MPIFKHFQFSIQNHHSSAMAYAEAVEEITEIYKSLPPRPSVEEVSAAVSLLQTVESEEQFQLEEISKQLLPQDVPPQLFSVLKEMRKAKVSFRRHQQWKEASQLVELDKIFKVFDGLIQKASVFVTGGAVIEEGEEPPQVSEQNDGVVDDSKARVDFPETGEGVDKLNLIQLGAVIENFAKTGAGILDLGGKLMDKVEWLPYSIGKLSDLIELYISENQIMALPTSIGGLNSLTKLDLHGNHLINLPTSFGELYQLNDLDLSSNRLKSLPESFGSLKSLLNLDLSCNGFTQLPSVVGYLSFLQKLNVAANDLEELPQTIGMCSSLVELRLDFNQLKALPDVIGKLECLEILTLHFNRVKRLPSTMGHMSRLRELDASFNELEFIPESLCSTSLRKMNVGKNFSDLEMLPESIGNLRTLEELDISDCQIRVLPDSFRFLSSLRTFNAHQTPLDVPPREIARLGAQDVVEYMNNFVGERDLKLQRIMKKRGLCSCACLLFCLGFAKP